MDGKIQWTFETGTTVHMPYFGSNSCGAGAEHGDQATAPAVAAGAAADTRLADEQLEKLLPDATSVDPVLVGKLHTKRLV